MNSESNAKSCFSEGTQNPHSRSVTYTPRADVSERENSFEVILNVPGASTEGLDIHLERSILTVTAKCSLPALEGGELLYGDAAPERIYRRVFSLSDGIDPEGVQAELKHGVLRIELAKSARLKPQRIQIRS